jgi:hypothetical protein
MLTMLLGGLWHGAAWGFVVWGGLHGVYLVVERWALRDRTRDRDTSRGLPVILVFAIVTLTWIPFRAGTLSAARDVLSALFGPLAGLQLTSAPLVVGLMGLLTLIIDRADIAGRVDPVEHTPSFVRGLVFGSAMVAAILFASVSAVPFIYFQF